MVAAADRLALAHQAETSCVLAVVAVDAAERLVVPARVRRAEIPFALPRVSAALRARPLVPAVAAVAVACLFRTNTRTTEPGSMSECTPSAARSTCQQCKSMPSSGSWKAMQSLLFHTPHASTDDLAKRKHVRDK